MQDVYKNIEDYNPVKKRKVLIVFDDMIADMINNKKLNSVVTELFIRGRKLNISIVFITQSFFKVPKEVKLNTTHFFVMKISNFRKLLQIIHQILTLKMLRRFIKNILQNHTLFWLMIQFYLLIIF